MGRKPCRSSAQINFVTTFLIFRGNVLIRFRIGIRRFVENSNVFSQNFVIVPNIATSNQFASFAVYLKNVRYNVLYPVIEFMYTGRANIESTDVFEEIKTFAQNINFRPFSSLWNAIPAMPPLIPLPTTGVSSPSYIPTSANVSLGHPMGLISHEPMNLCRPMGSVSHERSNIPLTQVTSSSNARVSTNFSPTFTSTPAPAPTRDTPSTAPYPSQSPFDQRLVDLAILSESSRVSPMSPRANIAPGSMALNIVQQTPPRPLQPSSSKQRQTSSKARTFLGFSPKDFYNCSSLSSSPIVAPLQSNHNDSSINSVHNFQSMNTFDPNSSIIELSEISDASPVAIRKKFNLADIDENDVEIGVNVRQEPIKIPASGLKAVKEKRNFWFSDMI